MTPAQEYVRTLDIGDRGRGGLLRIVHLDPVLLLLLLLLSVSGLFVLYSASDYPLAAVKRQAGFFVVGYLVMLVCAQLPMLFYRRMAPVLYVTGVFFLLLVPVFGDDSKGAQRWLELPGLPRFQPSEILKILMPLMVAWYLSPRILPPRLKYIAAVLLMIFVPTLLIAMQPDLGTSILIASSGLFVLLLAGLSWWYVGAALLAGLASAWPMWQFVLHDYQKRRILTLLDPESDKFGAGWNILQSKTAIGSGGLAGKGWLEGTQSQLNFLPESHTDFIIAVLAEEFGLLGVLLLLGLYLAIIGRVLYIGFQSATTFNKLVAGSLGLTFFVYVFVNMGMVSGILPVVGVPLPLVSRGGTSIVSLLLAFGIIMAIANDNPRFSRI